MFFKIPQSRGQEKIMKGKRRIVAVSSLALALIFAFGCFTHTYHVGKGAPTGKVVYQKWHSHWLSGLISTNPDVNIKELCPSGNATIVDQHTFVNLLIAAFIGIIWYPTTVTVKCADGSTSEIEISPETAAQIVADDNFLMAVNEIAPESALEAAVAHENAILFLNGNSK